MSVLSLLFLLFLLLAVCVCAAVAVFAAAAACCVCLCCCRCFCCLLCVCVCAAVVALAGAAGGAGAVVAVVLSVLCQANAQQRAALRSDVLNIGFRCSDPALVLAPLFDDLYSVVYISATLRPFEWLTGYGGLDRLQRADCFVVPSQPVPERLQVLLCQQSYVQSGKVVQLAFVTDQLQLSEQERRGSRSMQQRAASLSLGARVGLDMLRLLHDVDAALLGGTVALVLFQSNAKLRSADALMSHLSRNTSDIPFKLQDLAVVGEKGPDGNNLPVEYVLNRVMQNAAAGRKVLLFSVLG